jgi:hypothetical protein
LFGQFVALGYGTIASLYKPPIAPQKSEIGPLVLYPLNRLVTGLVMP